MHGALLLIEVSNHYHEAANQTVLLFRLQHAAVALITMLLFQGALLPQRHRKRRGVQDDVSPSPLAIGISDTYRVHKGLMFVIQILKEHEGRYGSKTRARFNRQQQQMQMQCETQQSGVFEGIAIALERLLTAASRLTARCTKTTHGSAAAGANKATTAYRPSKQQRMPAHNDTTTRIMEATSSAEQTPINDAAGPNTATTPANNVGWEYVSRSSFTSSSGISPNNEQGLMPSDTLAQLDNQLLRLMSGLPATESHDVQMNSSTLPTAWDHGAQQPRDAPQRPAWVADDLWQSIFDTINDWNVIP